MFAPSMRLGGVHFPTTGKLRPFKCKREQALQYKTCYKRGSDARKYVSLFNA